MIKLEKISFIEKIEKVVEKMNLPEKIFFGLFSLVFVVNMEVDDEEIIYERY